MDETRSLHEILEDEDRDFATDVVWAAGEVLLSGRLPDAMVVVWCKWGRQRLRRCRCQAAASWVSLKMRALGAAAQLQLILKGIGACSEWLALWHQLLAV